MHENQSGKVIKDSTVAQISAAVFYQAHVMAKLMDSKRLSQEFAKTMFNQINKDFGNYVDAQARVKSKELHHVYEWKKVGKKDYRLFKLNKFTPSFTAVPSETSRRAHVFSMKASVMEAGKPLIIAPRHSERLVFKGSTGIVFLPKGQSVTVSKPGGAYVKDSFRKVYIMYFKGNLLFESVKKSEFKKVLKNRLTKSLRLPSEVKRISYSFSPASLAAKASLAVEI
jgi:ethanolamine utilization protein EutQ (cupin superfamily)